MVSELPPDGSAIRDGGRATWLRVFRRYLAAIAIGNLVWEFAHLPLYTVWRQDSPRGIVFAALHCTLGDILIAAACLVGALLVLGNIRWPAEGYWPVAALAVAGGLAYTMYSEWLHTELRGSWAYTESMPTLPVIGTGLSPLAQWLAVPAASFWWTYGKTSKHSEI